MTSAEEAYRAAAQADVELRQDLLDNVLELGPPVPELYFATVRAVGTPLHHTVIEPLTEALADVGFLLFEIKLSQRLFDPIPVSLPLPQGQESPHLRYVALTNAADYLRSSTGRKDALAVEAIRHLHLVGRRQARREAREQGFRGIAYLFRNLMHPHEAQRLYRMYGKQLFILSIFSPEEERLRHHANQLAGDDPMRADMFREEAQEYFRRESGYPSPTESLDKELVKQQPYRINIPRTWQHGDLFLNISDAARTSDQIKRLIELIFRHPFHTPRPEEIGMAEAFLAATESANVARQVGASIVSPDGELLAVGTNDVPKPTGGIYRAGMEPDHRDHTDEYRKDMSDVNRRGILVDLIKRQLADSDWLVQAGYEKSGEDPALDYDILSRMLINSPIARSAQFFDVIEYGRTLHAEMDAITSAARKGTSLRGSTLYCTTLPCHECARLIIGAGVKRVIFVEPYEKSRAAILYKTEINFTTMSESLRKDSELVDFVPYVGISPRRFYDVFSPVIRKRDDLPGAGPQRLDGAIVDWSAGRKVAKTRDTIVSDSGFESVSKMYDRLVHEHNTISDYEKTYSVQDARRQ